jgi:hypothetical protein
MSSPFAPQLGTPVALMCCMQMVLPVIEFLSHAT